MQNIAARFAQVFWGLAIVGVDIHLRRFDVLPDFVGYLLIAVGAGGLLGLSNHFSVAKVSSWILVPVSAALLVLQGTPHKLCWLVSVVLEAVMIWFLLGGVMAFAQSRGRSEWVSRGSTCRLVYVGLLCAGVVIGWISGAVPSVARILGTGTWIAMLLLVAVILHLIYLVKDEALRAGQSEAVTDTVKEAA